MAPAGGILVSLDCSQQTAELARCIPQRERRVGITCVAQLTVQLTKSLRPQFLQQPAKHRLQQQQDGMLTMQCPTMVTCRTFSGSDAAEKESCQGCSQQERFI